MYILVHGVVVGLLHLAHLGGGLHVTGPHRDVLYYNILYYSMLSPIIV